MILYFDVPLWQASDTSKITVRRERSGNRRHKLAPVANFSARIARDMVFWTMTQNNYAILAWKRTGRTKRSPAICRRRSLVA
jgi:hypothetical protein